jgi:hypothetical protein
MIALGMVFRWIIFPAALLCGAPAAADVTARFVPDRGGATMMTIEVNDKGDARVSMGSREAVLTINGIAYVVAADLDGPYAVRQDDWVATQNEAAPIRLPDRTRAAFDIVDEGAATVSRRTGTLWTVRPHGMPRTAGTLAEMVISADPGLAAVGRAYAAQFAASTRARREIGNVADFNSKLLAILAKGTMIRLVHAMRLDSVDDAPVPASRFVLPGPLLTRDQYAARAGTVVPH